MHEYLKQTPNFFHILTVNDPNHNYSTENKRKKNHTNKTIPYTLARVSDWGYGDTRSWCVCVCVCVDICVFEFKFFVLSFIKNGINNYTMRLVAWVGFRQEKERKKNYQLWLREIERKIEETECDDVTVDGIFILKGRVLISACF